MKLKIKALFFAALTTIFTYGSVVPVNAAVTTQSADVTVTFNINVDSLSMTLVNNTVPFGLVADPALGRSTAETITAKVKSSIPYDIKIKSSAQEFQNSATKYPVGVLKAKLNAEVDKNISTADVNLNATPLVGTVGQEVTHTIGFTLDSLVGYPQGNYTGTMTITATQS